MSLAVTVVWCLRQSFALLGFRLSYFASTFEARVCAEASERVILQSEVVQQYREQSREP